MAYPKITDPIARWWFDKAIGLKEGSHLLIPCTSKSEQGSLKTKLYALRKEYSERHDATESEKLTFSRISKGVDFYLKASKHKTSSLVGYLVDEDGNIEKIQAENPIKRQRMIKLMKEDGRDLDAVEEVLGPLSAEDRRIYENHKV